MKEYDPNKDIKPVLVGGIGEKITVNNIDKVIGFMTPTLSLWLYRRRR